MAIPKPSIGTIWKAMTEPAETVDSIKDLAYVTRNCMEPAWKVGIGLKMRKVKRSYRRLGDALSR